MALEEMKQRKREEYEMQLFGVRSREAYDGIKNMIEGEIESLCNGLCRSIEKKFKPGPEELAILKTDAKQLTQTYENKAETHMNELNKIIKRFIAVPNHLLLEEDKNQAVRISQDELDEMNRKLEELEKRAKKAAMFGAALKQELEIQEKFKICEESIKKSCKEIENNTILPYPDNKIQKFTEESEKLYTQLAVFEPTNDQENIYRPIIKNLKELDSI